MALETRGHRWRSPRRAAAPDPARALRRKFFLLAGVVGLAFLALTLQLVRLQVLETGRYTLLAEDNRLRLVPVPPPRGLIFDRNGRTIAENVATYSAVLVPADLPRGREGEVFAALQDLLNVPAFEIEQRVSAARRRHDPFSPIVVEPDIGQERALVLAERRRYLPGVDVHAEPVRVYPFGDLTSHITGYTGRIEPDELDQALRHGYLASDRTGKTGVELTYEGYLRGMAGRREAEVDASGRELRALGGHPPRPGYSVTLAVDIDLQRAVRDILEESVRDLASKKAVAIVMDVRTGEILADVSLPSYDANIFSRRLDEAKYDGLVNNPDKPLLDHAIAEKFAPGSTFKIVTGLAALQEDVATPATTIYSNGSMLVPRDDGSKFDSFPDWRPGLGSLSFYRGIAMSSDIYFYCLAGGCDQLRAGLGNERLARYARLFGFGEPTGIDLPGEAGGLIGDAVWLKRVTSGAQNWFLADTYYQGIGQGYVEATPLQVVRMTAAVANGGRLLRPRVMREVRDADGAVVVPAHIEVQRQLPIADEHFTTMREAMRQAVFDGTATAAGVKGVSVAGKTGTAEFGTRIGAGSVYGRYKEHGWFTGFAPYENPEIAVVVFHEQGGGALTAAPTTGRIFQAYFDLKARRASR
ncbi:MAG: penicillin-binding protein 2 [Dehalococcoidia bacterium]